ncbi:MAG: deoxyguanosinetriphosphate triphosphohydrolase [Bacteroidales bacterium]|nr:deoxyguanosinetriphosphate triphosphohydrolase [Bacteroidales bacterium]NLK81779.1 deoxyguanosinetriphosphate triphosphohydrolase [Bacteroidales bacterium]
MLDWKLLLSHERLGTQEKPILREDAARSQFQRDYDRIIFSSPFRRLQNKTQVFPLPGSVFVHNRLTHSLEVASVGRTLGNIIAKGLLQKNVDVHPFILDSIGSIVSTACLAHDLGNPPFGHSGESAISRYFTQTESHNIQSLIAPEEYTDLIHFEGNANAFRLLTHQFTGRRQGGFALTYATIGALLKYPCTSTDLKNGNAPYEKYGIFQTEKDTFIQVAQKLGLRKLSNSGHAYCRHPLVFLMEAADDICYQIVDLEDAHRLGIISGEVTKSLLFSFFDPQKDAESLQELQSLLSEVSDENEQIVILRSRTINKLIEDCALVFWEHYEDIMNGVFYSSLTKNLTGSSKHALQEISLLATEKIYNSKEVVEIQIAGHRILGELLHEFVSAIRNNDSLYTTQLLRLLPTQLRCESDNTYHQIMSVIDYISGMTDVYALEIYRKIKGISFSVIR